MKSKEALKQLEFICNISAYQKSQELIPIIEKDLKKFEVQSLCLESLQDFINKELNKIDKELKTSQEELDILYFKGQKAILDCVHIYLETLKYESTADMLVDYFIEKVGEMQ